MRAVAEAWPNVTAIGVREGIARVAAMLDGIAAATRWAALATLSTGLMVLIGAAAAGERRRVYEAAVLKTLGASRGRILASFALARRADRRRGRLVAIVAGGVAGWAVTVFVLEGDFRFAAAERARHRRRGRAGEPARRPRLRAAAARGAPGAGAARPGVGGRAVTSARLTPARW